MRVRLTRFVPIGFEPSPRKSTAVGCQDYWIGNREGNRVWVQVYWIGTLISVINRVRSVTFTISLAINMTMFPHLLQLWRVSGEVCAPLGQSLIWLVHPHNLFFLWLQNHQRSTVRQEKKCDCVLHFFIFGKLNSESGLTTSVNISALQLQKIIFWIQKIWFIESFR